MAVGTATAIAIGLGAAGAGFAASKSGIFGGGPKQPISAPMPLPQAPRPEAAAEKAAEIGRKKKAVATTSIYTSPLGVAGEANVARKTLLGQ